MPRPGPKKTVSDAKLAAVVAEITAGEEPFAATQEVADKTGLRQPSALERLKELQSDGVLGGKRAGNNWAWWVR